MAQANMRLVEPPPRSPEREALAAAIARHAAAIESVRRVKEAHEHAVQTVYAASDRLKVAEAKLAEMNQSEGEDSRLAGIALGEIDAGSLVTADTVEVEITRTKADLDIAKRTREALQQRIAREATEVERAKSALDAAVAAVVQADTPITDMLKRARQLQDELINARVVIRHLWRTESIAAPEQESARTFLHDIWLPGGAGQIEYADYNNSPAAAPWRAAAEALRQDADAALPTSCRS